jgi:hypothetical protein
MKKSKKAIDMNVIERIQAPTPKFFQNLAKIGYLITAVGGVLTTAPVSLPVGVIALGGYLLTGGAVLSVFSNLPVQEEPKD